MASDALDPHTALAAAARQTPHPTPRPAAVAHLLVAGAGGPLGRAVLKDALGRGRFASVGVLTRAPLQPGLRRLRALRYADDVPLPASEVAVVVFDRGRDHHGRDEAYHLPEPAGLPRLAARLRASGVHTLAVVCPIAPALLPPALQQGLANLDEQAVAALGFERLLFVRPTQDAPKATLTGWPQRLARWMLSQLHYMVPQQERPLRAESVAHFVFEVLQQWPDAAPGTRVAGAPLLWAAAQKEGAEAVVRRWLQGDAASRLPQR